MDFAVWLRSARRSAGLTLDQVARRAGLSEGAICRLERGSRQPQLSTAIAVADAVGVPLWRALRDAQK